MHYIVIIWNHAGIIVEAFCYHSGGIVPNLGSFWYQFGSILTSCCEHVLESCWHHFGSMLGIILVESFRIWDNFGANSGEF